MNQKERFLMIDSFLMHKLFKGEITATGSTRMCGNGIFFSVWTEIISTTRSSHVTANDAQSCHRTIRHYFVLYWLRRCGPSGFSSRANGAR